MTFSAPVSRDALHGLLDDLSGKHMARGAVSERVKTLVLDTSAEPLRLTDHDRLDASLAHDVDKLRR